MVAGGGGGDEGVDGGEGVRGRDEDGGEGRGEGRVRGEEGEVEEEEDEAVFAAVVGEGERFEAGLLKCVGERVSGRWVREGDSRVGF